MAAAKKAPAKKATAKKTTRKTAPKKASKQTTTLRNNAEKAVNVYLGVIGKGMDRIQENLDTARKDNEKRVKELEKRGAKLRTAMKKRFNDIDVPTVDTVMDDAKEQFSKVQDQVEDAVENVKEKLTPAKAA